MAISMHRRRFVTTAMAGCTALTTPTAALAQEKHDVLVDCHLHCFGGRSDPRFPYHPRAPYQPDELATPKHLMMCMDQAGIAYAIVVHPEPYQDDHRYLEHCLEVGKGRLKGTLLLFADRDSSVEKMPELVKRIDAVAVRVHAYAPDRLPPFGKPELRQLWKQASDLGLAIQLHFEPRYAPGFEPLIREFRGTRVIIDHLGRPFQGTAAEHLVVVRWSRFPNTVMKISSLPATRTYPHRDVRPTVKQLTDAYGAERMICGGGYSASATGKTYREAFARTRSFIGHLTPAEQAMVLGQNAATMFGFRPS